MSDQEDWDGGVEAGWLRRERAERQAEEKDYAASPSRLQRVILVKGKLWLTFYKGVVVLVTGDHGHIAEYRYLSRTPQEENSKAHELFRFMSTIRRALREYEEEPRESSGARGSSDAPDIWCASPENIQAIVEPSDDVMAEHRHRATIRVTRQEEVQDEE